MKSLLRIPPYLAVMFVLAIPAFGQFGGRGSVSGRLMAEYSTIQCRMACEVRLETLGMQVIDTTFADSEGNFSFAGVMPGTYFIRATLEGYQEVLHQVDVTGFDGGRTFIVLTRKPEVSNIEDAKVVHVTQILDQYPDKAVGLYKKAIANNKKGKRDEAIRQLEEATRIAPNFFIAYNDLGALYRAAGRTADAEASFVRAGELSDKSIDALLNLGSLYIDEKRFADAIRVSERALEIEKNSPVAMFNLGLALYENSSLEAAEETLKKVLVVAPRLFQARLVLANIYMKMQRFDSLIEQLDRYLADNPNGEHRIAAQEMRERIMTAKQEAVP